MPEFDYDAALATQPWDDPVLSPCCDSPLRYISWETLMESPEIRVEADCTECKQVHFLNYAFTNHVQNGMAVDAEWSHLGHCPVCDVKGAYLKWEPSFLNGPTREVHFDIQPHTCLVNGQRASDTRVSEHYRLTAFGA